MARPTPRDDTPHGANHVARRRFDPRCFQPCATALCTRCTYHLRCLLAGPGARPRHRLGQLAIFGARQRVDAAFLATFTRYQSGERRRADVGSSVTVPTCIQAPCPSRFVPAAAGVRTRHRTALLPAGFKPSGRCLPSWSWDAGTRSGAPGVRSRPQPLRQPLCACSAASTPMQAPGSFRASQRPLRGCLRPRRNPSERP